jgi:hypothetical protein
LRQCKSPRAWAYGKEKIRGAERNLPDFFGLCPRCQKKFSAETFQNCCRRGGGRSDYEKFLLDSIFPTKLTEFLTKLTEFVPFNFIISQYCPTVKRILPDWLCLPNKLGGLPPPPPPPGTPMPKGGDFVALFRPHSGVLAMVFRQNDKCPGGGWAPMELIETLINLICSMKTVVQCRNSLQ